MGCESVLGNFNEDSKNRMAVDYLLCFEILLVFSSKKKKKNQRNYSYRVSNFENFKNDSNYCNLSDIQALSEY